MLSGTLMNAGVPVVTIIHSSGCNDPLYPLIGLTAMKLDQHWSVSVSVSARLPMPLSHMGHSHMHMHVRIHAYQPTHIVPACSSVCVGEQIYV